MMGLDEERPDHINRYPVPLGFNGRGRAALYRWFSGRPLDGRRYTNATGFRYGTHGLGVDTKVGTYKLLPGYKRFLYFRAPITAAPLELAAYLMPDTLMYPLFDMRLHAVAAAGGLVVVGDRIWDGRHERRFRREVVRPLAAASANVLRREYVKALAHSWVQVPRDFRDDEQARILIKLPHGWVGDEGDRKRLSEVVNSRLQLEDVLTASWNFGEDPHVSFKVPQQPPKLVSFEEAREDLMSSGSEAPLLGYGVSMRKVSFSRNTEAPHLLIAGGTGAGKSELIADIVSQDLRNGHALMVLDAKYVSHMWLRKIPQVYYGAEDHELHEGLMWLDEEIKRRAREYVSNPDVEFIPLTAVLEEMSSATNRLRGYWRSIKGSGDPMMSPALTALNNVANMGRELKVFILLAGQSLSSKAIGGVETRENFTGRCFARSSANSWRQLAPQIKNPPMKNRGPGRWHIVVGDTIKEFQVPFMDLKNNAQRLIEFATGGDQIPDMRVMMTPLAQSNTPTSPVVSSEIDDANMPSDDVTLSQFSQRDGNPTLTQLNNWRQRDPNFPQPIKVGANRAQVFSDWDLASYVLRRKADVD